MPVVDTIVLGIIAVNVLLTLILAVIYLKNYRTISSRVTLGLAVFAIAFMLKNLLDFFFYNSLLQQGITGLTTFHLSVNVFTMIALVILVWVTWK